MRTDVDALSHLNELQKNPKYRLHLGGEAHIYGCWIFECQVDDVFLLDDSDTNSVESVSRWGNVSQFDVHSHVLSTNSAV